MALIVEVFKRNLDLEIAMMTCPEDDPLVALYMQGAAQALQWVRDGGMKPSVVLAQAESAKLGGQLQ